MQNSDIFVFETKAAINSRSPTDQADGPRIASWVNSSRDYDASPGLEKIEAALLAINSADDERNPPETGLTERAVKQVKNGKLYLIPASEQTTGHGTTGNAKFYKQQLQDLLDAAPRRVM